MQNVRKFSVVDDALKKRLVNCAEASPTSTAFACIHIYPFDAIDNHGTTSVGVPVAVDVGVLVAVSVAVAVGVGVND
jgi:hypothetical protein